MRAIEGREHVRHGGLHADRHAGDAGGRQFVDDGIRHGVGIRLDGDLRAGGDAEGLADAPEHPGEVARRQQRRRAAAEEDGGCRPDAAGGREHVSGELDLAQQRVGVLVLARTAQLAGRVGVEVAVPAPHAAERHVQVDPERRRVVDRDRQRAVAGRRLTDRERGAHQAGVAYSGEIARR